MYVVQVCILIDPRLLKKCQNCDSPFSWSNFLADQALETLSAQLMGYLRILVCYFDLNRNVRCKNDWKTFMIKLNVWESLCYWSPRICNSDLRDQTTLIMAFHWMWQIITRRAHLTLQRSRLHFLQFGKKCLLIWQITVPNICESFFLFILASLIACVALLFDITR